MKFRVRWYEEEGPVAFHEETFDNADVMLLWLTTNRGATVYTVTRLDDADDWDHGYDDDREAHARAVGKPIDPPDDWGL